jgi:hypothetical protein
VSSGNGFASVLVLILVFGIGDELIAVWAADSNRFRFFCSADCWPKRFDFLFAVPLIEEIYSIFFTTRRVSGVCIFFFSFSDGTKAGRVSAR